MTGTKVAIVSGNNVGLGRVITERLPEINYQKPEIIRSKDYNLKNSDSALRLVKETVERFGGIEDRKSTRLNSSHRT